MTAAPTPVRGPLPRPLHATLLAVLLLVLAAGVLLLSRYDSGSSSSTKVLEGSGVSVRQGRSLPSFTAIELAGANNVAVHVGRRQPVDVQADDNLIELVTTEVDSGTLVIAARRSFNAETFMKVDVTVPELEAATLRGTGVISIDGVEGPQFHARLLGTGLVTVRGAVDRLSATVAGDGDAQLQDLVARDVAATVSGTGRLQVHATDSLDASVPGTGAIFYTGNPSDVRQNVTETGAIVEQ